MLKVILAEIGWPSLAPIDPHSGHAFNIISIVKFGAHFDYLKFAFKALLMSYLCRCLCMNKSFSR